MSVTLNKKVPTLATNRDMRFDREPPKLDPKTTVVAGEILDTEADAAKFLGIAHSQLRELRLTGQSPVPFILCGEVAFYPRRGGLSTMTAQRPFGDQ